MFLTPCTVQVSNSAMNVRTFYTCKEDDRDANNVLVVNPNQWNHQYLVYHYTRTGNKTNPIVVKLIGKFNDQPTADEAAKKEVGNR